MRTAAIALTSLTLLMTNVAINNLHLIRLPEVERPRVEEWGFCIDPETDGEIERCSGLRWSIDIEARNLFLGEQQ